MTDVLILEDELTSLQALSEILTTYSDDIRVHKASSLKEAKDLLDQEIRYGLFLLDVNLSGEDREDIGGILFAKSLSYEGRMEKAEDAYEKKAYEKAISYAKQALEKKKEDALAYAVIGKSYYQKKEDEAAKAYLEKAVEKQQEDKEVYRFLIDLYDKDSDYEAISDLYDEIKDSSIQKYRRRDPRYCGFSKLLQELPLYLIRDYLQNRIPSKRTCSKAPDICKRHLTFVQSKFCLCKRDYHHFRPYGERTGI